MNPTLPKKPAIHLASKTRDSNPNHHLFNNNGTWWCQVTVHRGPFSNRLRFSLETSDLETARSRRNSLFSSLTSQSKAAKPGALHELGSGGHFSDSELPWNGAIEKEKPILRNSGTTVVRALPVTC